eukprot:5097555-Amphidinium_carterae.1
MGPDDFKKIAVFFYFHQTGDFGSSPWQPQDTSIKRKSSYVYVSNRDCFGNASGTLSSPLAFRKGKSQQPKQERSKFSQAEGILISVHPTSASKSEWCPV